MSTITKEKKAELVAGLRFDAGVADNADPRLTFPVPEHLRAVEPEVSLIVGDRGAGKTRLMRALSDADVRPALLQYTKAVRKPVGDVEWVSSWPIHHGPDQRALSQFALGHGRDDVMAMWFAYLVKALSERLSEGGRAAIAPLLAAPALDVDACVAAFRSTALEATAALDELDELLGRSDEWLFVSYDELDTLVFEDWAAMRTLVSGVVSHWAAYARRWRRIRPKVFLRSDFYERRRDIAGADIAKLAANRVQLTWSNVNLYGAMIYHVLNAANGEAVEDLRKHLRRSVKIEEDSVLGDVPRLTAAKDAKPFVDRLAGEYMGANPRKGSTFKWLLDHLRDGNGRVVPRTLVMLIEESASIENADPKAQGARLLHHTSIRNGLDRVSEQYVNNARTHEFPWLYGLADRLKAQRLAPWPRKELERMLQVDFKSSWGADATRRDAAPGEDAREVVDTLLELGILKDKKNGSIDVPDVYLRGLGLRRKGGVPRA